MPSQFQTILARLLVKSMRSTLREAGPMSGGSGARLFSPAVEEALSEALASGLRRREPTT